MKVVGVIARDVIYESLVVEFVAMLYYKFLLFLRKGLCGCIG